MPTSRWAVSFAVSTQLRTTCPIKGGPRSPAPRTRMLSASSSSSEDAKTARPRGRGRKQAASVSYSIMARSGEHRVERADRGLESQGLVRAEVAHDGHPYVEGRGRRGRHKWSWRTRAGKGATHNMPHLGRLRPAPALLACGASRAAPAISGKPWPAAPPRMAGAVPVQGRGSVGERAATHRGLVCVYCAKVLCVCAVCMK